MTKRYSITALCGMGLGTSSIARMSIMDYVNKNHIDASVNVADIGMVKSLNSDIVLTTKSMERHITDEVRKRSNVIFVTNLMKKDEVYEKLDDFFQKENDAN